MFEITGDQIALLNDTDLRTLVGLLCEVEVRSRGSHVAGVTWGGNQTATDGGIDVQVQLPGGVEISGFVPRPSTVFQVKAEDLQPQKILAEMKPKGTIRPAIKNLIAQSGAYVIVSSRGSTTHTALERRLKTMAQAVVKLKNHKALALDFYDRNRLATWVRDYPGLMMWVREKTGKPLKGWRGYGSWAYSPQGVDDKYFVDGKIRVQTGKKESHGGLSALEGVQHLRNLLKMPGKVIRLVGLSGVGKTRLVQALFDIRVGEGEGHLSPGLAAYTNVAHGPDPQPTVLAQQLIAEGKRSILVIDNCTPALHRELSEACRLPKTLLSVITVEYDVREDQQEGTDVVRLGSASGEFIENLVKQRFPEISDIDVRTIAKFADGNARIAIALGSTLEKDETIAGLKDEELFVRLFEQRHGHDEHTLLTAQACSLLYSFQGEDESGGDQCELARLGSLVGQNAPDMYRRVANLERRELVQRRGVWRAVLPHAVANRLAAEALRSISINMIERTLVQDATERMARSFSRRLGYLNDSSEAVEIVRQWLAQGGWLGTAGTLNDLGWSMFEDVAPVAPEATLDALERALPWPTRAEDAHARPSYLRLVRALAYDAVLFERCVALISPLAEEGPDGHRNEASQVLSSLFLPFLSGTRATLEQRRKLVEAMLVSGQPKERNLGLVALKAMLSSSATSHYGFEFGARHRDYGYWPSSPEEEKGWFGSALSLAAEVACAENPSAQQVREVVAHALPELWNNVGLFDEIEEICRTLSLNRRWPEGWIAVRQARYCAERGGLPETFKVRLNALEQRLQPIELVEKVRFIVLAKSGVYLETLHYEDGDQKEVAPESISRELGRAVASNQHAFDALIPELVNGSGFLCKSFGEGLAEGSGDPRDVWDRMVAQVAAAAGGYPNVHMLGGFLRALRKKDPTLVESLLEDAFQTDTLSPYYPQLQTFVGLDRSGVDRLLRSLSLGRGPLRGYIHLAYGGASDSVQGSELKALLMALANKGAGHPIAVEILSMRLQSDRSRNQVLPLEVVDIGCELVRRITFTERAGHEDYALGVICESCLTGPQGVEVARSVCQAFRARCKSDWASTWGHPHLLAGLFRAQPSAALDGMFGGDSEDLSLGIRVIREVARHEQNPLDQVPTNELLEWCAENPGRRYPAMAAVIPFSFRGKDTDPWQWKESALSLLEHAPDPAVVLQQFIAQFKPRSWWSNSRPSILESYVKGLDDLKDHSNPAVVTLAKNEAARLRGEIEEEKRSAAMAAKQRDERFE